MRGSGGAAARSSSQDATVLGRAPKPRSSRPPPAALRRALPHPVPRSVPPVPPRAPSCPDMTA